MRYIRSIAAFLLLSLPLLQGAPQSGTITSGGTPIPGATVTATLGDRKIVTSTDEEGRYALDLPEGDWSIEVQMFGFAPLKQEVKGGPGAKLDLALALQPFGAPAPATVAAATLALATPAVPAATASTTPPPARTRGEGGTGGPGGRSRQPGDRPTQQTARNGQTPQGQQRPGGFQNLAVTPDGSVDPNANLAPAPDLASDAGAAGGASESFLVNGSLSRGLQTGSEEVAGAMRMDPGMMRGGDPNGMGGPGGFGGNDAGTAGGFGAGGGAGGFGGGAGGFGGGGGGRGGGGGFGGPGGGRGGPGGGGRDRFANMTPEERAKAIERMRSQRGLPTTTAFGNRRNRNGSGVIRGQLSWDFSNSALNASPYSVTGNSLLTPAYASSRFGASIGGQLKIPHILTSNRTSFFINYQGSLARTPYTGFGTVPTLSQRAGDFSQSFTNVPVTIYDPLTNQPFANNRIPASRISPTALGLLNFIPLPNVSSAANGVQNYQLLTAIPRNSQNVSVRLNHSLNQKDRLALNFSTQNRDGINQQLYGYQDSTDGTGISADLSWAHTFGAQTINNLRLVFNLNRNNTLPYFAYSTDIESQLGIAGVANRPLDFGPPNLDFTNFGSLSDASPLARRNQSLTLSDGVTMVRGTHSMSFGGELKRVHLDTNTDQNARGTYSLSGLATSGLDANGVPIANTGFDFADFLLGLPQSSSIRFGSADTYFRAWTMAAYAQDDWRVRSNLTINLGVRYDFFQPFSEKYGRMANLDIAPNFTGVAVVVPGGVGPYSGQFGNGLIDSYPLEFAPRGGFAWRPNPKGHLQVRGGYGLFRDGSVYNNLPARLAAQPPFAKNYAITTSLDQPITLLNGFSLVQPKAITNSYAIDRSFRPGYAQTWNLALQQELKGSMVLEVGYIGTKGTALDILRLPNRAAPGSPLTAEQRRQIGNATGFTFESSEGNSTFHAGQVRLVRRMRRGVSTNLLYTFSKSIDNSSNVGGAGGAGTVAQNDRDLSAERGLSAFDQRHALTLTTFVNSPFGDNGFWLKGDKGWTARLLKEWTLTGGMTYGSGRPFTARVLGNAADTAGTGSVGSGRASATGLPVDSGLGYFNTAAFTIPASGTFGNAGRDTIPGLPLLSFQTSLARSFNLGNERRRLEMRIASNNVTNHVNITNIATVVNASNFGYATAAGQMRSVTLTMRIRF